MGKGNPHIVERRIIVKGWKTDSRNAVRSFTETRPVTMDSVIDFQRSRIGLRDLPSWQPHITEVIVESRVITEWRVDAHYEDDTVGVYWNEATNEYDEMTDSTNRVSRQWWNEYVAILDNKSEMERNV